MPPAAPLLLIAIGLLVMSWRIRAGRLLASLGLVWAFVGSTGAAGEFLSNFVEGDLVGLRPEALQAALAVPDPPKAVVILSGGSEYDAREYPGPETLMGRSLARVVQGARVARESGLPILVSGGVLHVGKPAESVIMARILRDDFGLTPRWVDDASLDTAENAAFSARLLADAHIDSVILVTDALHMRRSIRAFESAGLKVLPAPVGFSGREGGDSSLGWFPTITGSVRVWAATHEIIGSLWYGLRRPVQRQLSTQLQGAS